MPDVDESPPLSPAGTDDGPPVAARRPRRWERFGRRFEDPWAWLRDREDPDTIRHLEAENAWTDRVLAPWSGLRDRIEAEMRSRIVPDAASPPLRHGPFLYQSRYRPGDEYALLTRRRAPTTPRGRPGPEEILLDPNRLAAAAHGSPDAGHFHLGAAEVAPRHDLLAFAVDGVGRRIYEIRFLDTRTGEFLADRIPGAAPNLVWAADGRTILYVRLDRETLRWDEVRRHRLGDAPEADRVVYREADEEYQVSVWESRSRELLLIHCQQTDDAEAWAVPSADPDAAPRRLVRRGTKHLFELDHFRGGFVLRTNRDAPDYRLVFAPGDDPDDAARWDDLIPHRQGVLVEGFELFDAAAAVFERRNGRQELAILDWERRTERIVPLPGRLRALDAEDNPEPDAAEVRVVVSGPKTAPRTLAVSLETGRRRQLKREDVPGFRAADYAERRLTARAQDGARIPISLVHHRNHPPGPGSPLLLYGYGAYGISMDPIFSRPRLSLLDRGFSFAIAHIRGGQELGRAWYEAGRQHAKENTFEDFIACARRLRDRGLCDPERMFAMGGSAGGLLMGAVVNRAPDLFAGAVAMVPFVDCLNTMLDETIPLTTNEYDEWGDPRDEAFFRRIAGYAPYENVPRTVLPHLFVTSGLHDSQVHFWEPTKWVQRLRARNADPTRRMLLRTNLDAGHGGRSGRYRGLPELAEIYAFLVGTSRAIRPSGSSTSRGGTRAG